MRPINIWMISTEDEFNRFVMKGGWVVLMCDTPNPIIASHPSSLGASILLPPYEAMTYELDNAFEAADQIYISHLTSDVCEKYISAILCAIIANIPIAIYFGPEEIEMRFVKTFMNFLYNSYGIVVGIEGKVNPCINECFLPHILAILYLNDIIDYQSFMTNHPLLQIDPQVIPKMAVEVNPLVMDTSPKGYYDYFMNVLAITKQNNNQLLIDPFVGDMR